MLLGMLSKRNKEWLSNKNQENHEIIEQSVNCLGINLDMKSDRFVFSQFVGESNWRLNKHIHAGNKDITMLDINSNAEIDEIFNNK